MYGGFDVLSIEVPCESRWRREVCNAKGDTFSADTGEQKGDSVAYLPTPRGSNILGHCWLTAKGLKQGFFPSADTAALTFVSQWDGVYHACAGWWPGGGNCRYLSRNAAYPQLSSCFWRSDSWSASRAKRLLFSTIEMLRVSPRASNRGVSDSVLTNERVGDHVGLSVVELANDTVVDQGTCMIRVNVAHWEVSPHGNVNLLGRSTLYQSHSASQS